MPQSSNIFPPSPLSKKSPTKPKIITLESFGDMFSLPHINKNAFSHVNTPAIIDLSRQSSSNMSKNQESLNFKHLDKSFEDCLIDQLRDEDNMQPKSEVNKGKVCSIRDINPSVNFAAENLSQLEDDKIGMLEEHTEKKDIASSNEFSSLSEEEFSSENESIESLYAPPPAKKNTKVTQPKTSVTKPKTRGINLHKKTEVNKPLILLRKNYLVLLMKIFPSEFAVNKDLILILEDLFNRNGNQTLDTIKNYYLSHKKTDHALPIQTTLYNWLKKFSKVKTTREHPFKDHIRAIFGEDAYNQNSNKIRWDKIEAARDKNMSLKGFIMTKKQIFKTAQAIEDLSRVLEEGMKVYLNSKKTHASAANLRDIERIFNTSFSMNEDTILKDIQLTLVYCPEYMVTTCMNVFLEKEEADKKKIDVGELTKKEKKGIRNEAKRLDSFFERSVRDHYPLLKKELINDLVFHESLRKIFSEIKASQKDVSIKRLSSTEETLAIPNTEKSEEELYKKYKPREGVFTKVYHANATNDPSISNKRDFLNSFNQNEGVPRISENNNFIFSQKKNSKNIEVINIEEDGYVDVNVKIKMDSFK